MQKLKKQLKEIIVLAKKELKKKEFKIIKKLRAKVSRPDFWQEQKKAKRISRRLNILEKEQNFWEEIKEEAQALLLLLDDNTLQEEVKKEILKLEKVIQQHQKHKEGSSRYDKNNALISIYAGAGGVDAMDWAEILFRMYLRFCEKRGWGVRLLNKSAGEEAGIKNVTFLVEGDGVYGQLKSEKGVHRLVRLSPFDADHARHTSFAKVEILPEIPEKEILLKDEDLEISTFRSSAPGGQKVNKTSSAVRIKHKPTGITAEAQSERSQYQNKIQALKILKAKLWKLAETEKQKEKIKECGENIPAEWGYQIRSYILHPYKQVKDHRTGKVIRNVEKIFKGDLDPFLEQ